MIEEADSRSKCRLAIFVVPKGELIILFHVDLFSVGGSFGVWLTVLVRVLVRRLVYVLQSKRYAMQ